MKVLEKKLKQPFLNGLPAVELPKDQQDNLEHVRNWLEFQPHLPQLTDEHVYLYLHACYDNLEKAKHMIESCYTFRTLTPELFSNRNIKGQDFQNVMDICELMVVPQPTLEGYDVAFFRFTNYDASKFMFADVLKAFFIAIDLYMSEYPMSKGCVTVFDIHGVSLGHLAKCFPMSLLRKPFFYVQECMAIRLKGVHIINTGTIIEKLMMMIKPFIKRELADMMHIHATVDTLADYLSLDVLPEEYGGKAGPSVTIYKEFQRTLETQYVEWFIEEEALRTDESKRIGKSDVKDTLFGVEGSFRKLEID